MFTPVQEPDGNLVLEMFFAETAFLDSIVQNSLDPFTCLVSQHPEVNMQCLDISGPSTLGGALDSKTVIETSDGLPQGVFYSYSYTPWETTDVTLFGNERLCSDGKRTGDGILDSLDLYSFMAWQFSIPPYNTLSTVAEEVHTVQGETALIDRCNDGVTRASYLYAFRPDDPCFRPSTRRRLQDGVSPSDPTNLDASVWMHRRLLDLDVPGTWFHIRLPRLAIAVQLLLEGSGNKDFVSLSSERVPLNPNDDATPDDPTKYELRFARHIEYYKTNSVIDERDCASIGSPLVGGTSMYYETISVGQVVDASRQFMCTFDLFLYKPNCGEGCELHVSAGSRAIDGLDGLIQKQTSAYHNETYNFTKHESVAPPSPPPQSPPSPPPPPPSPLPPLPPLLPNNEYVNLVKATMELSGDLSNFKEGEVEFELFKGVIALEVEVSIEDVIVKIVETGEGELNRRQLQSILDSFSVNVTVRTRTEKSTKLAIEFFELPSENITETFVEAVNVLQNSTDVGSGEYGSGSGDTSAFVWEIIINKVSNSEIESNIQYGLPAYPPSPPSIPPPPELTKTTWIAWVVGASVLGSMVLALTIGVCMKINQSEVKKRGGESSTGAYAPVVVYAAYPTSIE